MPTSKLRESVTDGLGALKRADNQLIDESIRDQFADSVLLPLDYGVAAGLAA